MENVTFQIKSGKLHIIVDPEKATMAPSSSGKTLRVASTLGNQSFTLPDGTLVKIGVNVYVPNPKK